MPMVKEGIFKYTSNGMYGVVFLVFWAVAIGFDSAGALVAAAFCHAYKKIERLERWLSNIQGGVQ